MNVVDRIQNMFTVGHDIMYIVVDNNSCVGLYYTYRVAKLESKKHTMSTIHPIFMNSNKWKKQLRIYKTLQYEDIITLSNNVLWLSYERTIGYVEVAFVLLMQYPELVAQYSHVFNTCKNIKFPHNRYSAVVNNFKKFLEAIPARIDYAC